MDEYCHKDVCFYLILIQLFLAQQGITVFNLDSTL